MAQNPLGLITPHGRERHQSRTFRVCLILWRGTGLGKQNERYPPLRPGSERPVAGGPTANDDLWREKPTRVREPAFQGASPRALLLLSGLQPLLE